MTVNIYTDVHICNYLLNTIMGPKMSKKATRKTALL